MLNERAERAVKLAGDVARLRAELRRFEDELNALVSDAPVKPSGATSDENRVPSNSESYKPTPGSVSDRAIKLLAGDPGKSMSAGEIQKALGIENGNSLRGTLNRLVAVSKLLKKPKRGRYKAA
jgi:hypothetical protein